MYDDNPQRSTTERTSTLEEVVAGFAATAVVIAALGGVYATTLLLGSGTTGVYPAAALVGLAIFVALPVGASVLYRAGIERLERLERRTREPSCDREPEAGPAQPDAGSIEH